MSKINFKGLDSKDALNVESLKNAREKIIQKSSYKPINQKYVSNELALKLHPKEQFVKVEKIIRENENVKTFVLIPDYDAGTKKLAFFRAGQYISVCVKIGVGVYRRAYTISCSPKHALNDYYTITIKRNEEGIVSNFFFEEVEEGYSFSVSAPTGNFYYSVIRDEKNVIALAFDSGIIPFATMAEAIYDGVLDFDLTILYGVEEQKDLIFKEKLDYFARKNKHIKVEYILSEEVKEGFKTGLIDLDLIEQYRKDETSFFVCGPLNFYEYMNEVLKELNIPKKYIRTDSFMGEVEVQSRSEYRLTVFANDQEYHITCRGNETLLQAMEENGIIVPNKCHVGECGFCRSKLISGMVKTFDDSIRAADKDYNYIHPCCSFPESDITIKLPN